MDLTQEQYEKQQGLHGLFNIDIVDNIAIIHMQCGENRINWSFIQKFNQALDRLESDDSIKALITTGEGRFYINGVDLDWAYHLLSPDGPGKLLQFRNLLAKLSVRLVTFPVPTIAAINGHCFGGGGVLAMCHDYIVMNSDRGWFCLKEVHLNLSFREASKVILRQKLPSGMVFNEVVVLGKQFAAEEAEKCGFIKHACGLKELIPTAMTLVRTLTKKGPYSRTSLGNMKYDMYGAAAQAYERQLASDENISSMSNL